MRRFTLLPVCLLASLSAHADVDPISGLEMTGDWELVRNNCSACHSTRLITQQRGSAEQWLKLIRWMQAEQNLWEFDAETERRIVTYLAATYPAEAQQRRDPIAPDLMPPNPYAPGAGDAD